MSVFEAATMIFGTVGTGGYGIYNDSAASFTPLQQNVITFFMIISGINYNMYFCLIVRQFKQAFRFEEIRWYLAIIFSSTCIITWNIHHMYPTIRESIRHAAFQVGSIITTSGFSTVDFDQWPQFSKTILVISCLSVPARAVPEEALRCRVCLFCANRSVRNFSLSFIQT